LQRARHFKFEFFKVHGFRQVSKSAVLDGFNGVLNGSVSCQYDDSVIFREHLDEIEAVGIRQPHVENDEIGFGMLKQMLGILPAFCGLDAIADMGELAGNEVFEDIVVLDHQNGFLLHIEGHESVLLASALGNSMVNVVPLPTRLSTSMRPW